ncbi:MAG: hypothetical protein ABR569_02640 [Gaiellaceae bacterium]
MTRPPEFDDLVGTEVEPGEQDRLRRVHELLVRAGPPPELSPELEAGPDLRVAYRHPRRPGRSRRAGLLAAAAVVALLAFLGGYLTGNHARPEAAAPTVRVIAMHGTASAPRVRASIRLAAPDQGGNWPMTLIATGLPKLRAGDYYLLLLTRKGQPDAPCGGFLPREGPIYLNAPYRLRPNDGWVITRQRSGAPFPGPVLATT